MAASKLQIRISQLVHKITTQVQQVHPCVEGQARNCIRWQCNTVLRAMSCCKILEFSASGLVTQYCHQLCWIANLKNIVKAVGTTLLSSLEAEIDGVHWTPVGRLSNFFRSAGGGLTRRIVHTNVKVTIQKKVMIIQNTAISW